jgi:hypothetical protein
MGQTPDDQRGGITDCDLLKLQDSSTDPANIGDVRNNAGTLKAKDASGVFSLRSGGATRVRGFGRASTNISTSSGTFSDVAGAAVTLTVAANSRLKITATASGQAGVANKAGKFIVIVDGVQQGNGVACHGHPESGSGQGGWNATISEYTNALSAGSHTVKLQYAATQGTMTINAASAPTTDGATLWAEEWFA